AYTATDKYGRSFTFENQIATTVGAGNIPKEDNECNFDAVGSVYSTDTGDGKILVLMADGQYHWFYRNEVLARILIEKLDENGELKEEYTREAVEERVAAERAQAEAEEQARLEAEAAAQAEAEAAAQEEADAQAENDASVEESTPVEETATQEETSEEQSSEEQNETDSE
ncbi:MAG: hypothetical protein MJ130_04040, partial [Lachnospiraceae bacterium]|nr:hypothetical protein [Lachnospiraceae bacterium]